MSEVRHERLNGEKTLNVSEKTQTTAKAKEEWGPLFDPFHPTGAVLCRSLPFQNTLLREQGAAETHSRCSTKCPTVVTMSCRLEGTPQL